MPDTEYTDDPVCPACGYVQSDAWEIGDGREGDFEMWCGECEADILISRHVSVSYSTKLAGSP